MEFILCSFDTINVQQRTTRFQHKLHQKLKKTETKEIGPKSHSSQTSR